MIMKRHVTLCVAFAALVAAACGPKPAPAPIPLLPGDGDAHVAKPPPRRPRRPSTIRGRAAPI